MKFADQNWYVKWFFWSLAIWEQFLNHDPDDRAEEVRERGTNLCFFFRTILISTPLVLLLHVLVYGLAIASLTLWPVYIFGGVGYISIILSIGAVCSIIFLVKMYKRRKELSEIQTTVDIDEKQVKPAQDRGPDFADIVWAWIVAGKKKICPTVTFSATGEERS